MPVITHGTPLRSTVRIRTSAPDPFAGLRGHDYIKARGLARKVQINGMPLLTEDCQCAPCVQQRLLPAVLRICASRAKRIGGDLSGPHWNNPHDDAAHQLLADMEV